MRTRALYLVCNKRVVVLEAPARTAPNLPAAVEREPPTDACEDEAAFSRRGNHRNEAPGIPRRPTARILERN